MVNVMHFLVCFQGTKERRLILSLALQAGSVGVSSFQIQRVFAEALLQISNLLYLLIFILETSLEIYLLR